ncbi:MAG: oxygen-independent coproporphyrinogen III oxidase [Caldithrix sp.]|nr:oxygen-independent coproporphyrinogen III oxidase [Caldithrix sp.]
MNVDIDLLKKYDRPGPRYTSYPTAPYFHEGVGSSRYMEHIDEVVQDKASQPISLYFHLPFCDTLCYFCGCNMLITHNPQRIDEYIDYLSREIEMLSRCLNGRRKVAQLHWGGGTPTHLSPDQIRRLGQAISRYFEFTDDAEVSSELDPRELTRDHMQALSDVGFNRCSMGVQDFDPRVQKAVNRIQPEFITRQTVEWARELNFKSINIDLMYGLPNQTRENFADTIQKVVDFKPDRLAVFNYAHLPDMIKHQRVIKDETLPTPDEKLKLLKLSIESLTDKGYVYIGMDHFAKPDDELTIAVKEKTLYRNFQGYSTRAGLDLFALGMSSISMLSGIYVQNYKKLKDYYNRIDDGQLPVMRGYELSADDKLRREVISHLMCHFELDKETINRKYDIDFNEYFAGALNGLLPLQDDGLVKLHDHTIEVTEPGRLLIRNIAMNFDAYLNQKSDHKPRFSRTV